MYLNINFLPLDQANLYELSYRLLYQVWNQAVPASSCIERARTVQLEQALVVVVEKIIGSMANTTFLQLLSLKEVHCRKERE